MATSTLMKFSLLTIIVVLSSYISFTKAVTPCSVSSTASSTDMLTAYNCTVQRCEVAHAACTGPNCVKVTALILYIKVQLYLAVKVFIGTCAPCSASHISAIRAILALIALIVTLVLSLIIQVLITIGSVLGIMISITAQLGICITALISISGGNLVITILNGLCTLAFSIMLSCVT